MASVNMIKQVFIKSTSLFFLIILLNTSIVKAQQSLYYIRGNVYEKSKNNEEIPLVHTKVLSDKKHFAFTDKEGRFELPILENKSYFIVYNASGEEDTIQITDIEKDYKIVFPYRVKIKEIVVSQKKFSTEISLLTTQKYERISSKELLKAACCNLSESFETTPSVDANFTDAITGYRQIQLLGLAGHHTLVTTENIPSVRGLAAITGLTYMPGQWIEGMQLSKGTGSVVNGFEGLAGQINVEMKKPMEDEKQFYNFYQSTQGRTEANVHLAFNPKKNYYTNLFLHGKKQWMKVDQNHDHFLDQLMGNSYIISNRWILLGKNGKELQLGAKYTRFNQWGGQTQFDVNEDAQLSPNWGAKINTDRLDLWAKTGKLFVQKPWKSIGWQHAFSIQNQHQFFGRKNYDANEKNYYSNLIYQTIVKHTGSVLKLGSTMQYTTRNENVMGILYKNEEITGGIYGEYAYTFSKKWNAVWGLRTDYHNKYGIYITPRMHVRYAPSTQFTLRASVGKAYRTAAIFAENLGYFATNRTLEIVSSNKNGIYGLQNEKAWNAGINGTYKFKLNYRQGTISADYYYTYFVNQVVADWEHERYLRLYNATKPSVAHSAQIQLDYEPIKRWDVRLAYRFHKVEIPYASGTQIKPLNSLHRAFVNTAYTTRNKWSGDITIQWTGSKRIPSTKSNPIDLQLPTQSPSYFMVNAQLSKNIKKVWHIYTGVENLFNYMQRPTVIDAHNPFGNYFDASLIWGPAMGRNIYVGVNYKLDK